MDSLQICHTDFVFYLNAKILMYDEAQVIFWAGFWSTSELMVALFRCGLQSSLYLLFIDHLTLRN